MTSEMLLPSLFCLVLVVLHVEETIGKYLRAVAFCVTVHQHPVLFPICLLFPSQLFKCVSSYLSPASVTFSILVPDQKILASPGDTLTLPCSVTPAFHPSEVRWYRPDKYDTPILLYKKPQVDEQVAADPQYSGRASLVGGLEEGNVSLKLDNITVADSGEYFCYIQDQSWYEKGRVLVEVRGKNTPNHGGSVVQ